MSKPLPETTPETTPTTGELPNQPNPEPKTFQTTLSEKELSDLAEAVKDLEGAAYENVGEEVANKNNESLHVLTDLVQRFRDNPVVPEQTDTQATPTVTGEKPKLKNKVKPTPLNRPKKK